MQTVITADVVTFDTKQKFDRVVSIEMFEHMKNYQVRFNPSLLLATQDNLPLYIIPFRG